MTRKNKFLVTTSSLLMAAVIGCVAIALMPQSPFKTAGQSNSVWKHYAERMPSVNPGVREYWAGCDSHTYQFTQPSDGTIQEADNWDTSEFAVNDDRYTLKCAQYIADSALANANAVENPDPMPAQGFAKVSAMDYTLFNAGCSLCFLSKYVIERFSNSIIGMGLH